MSTWHGVFFAGDRLRSGWRLLLFVGVFLVLLTAGGLVVGGLAAPVGLAGLVLQGTLMLAAAVAAGAILLRAVDDRPVGALGFGWTGRTLREIGVGLAIGVGAVAAVVLALAVPGWITYAPEAGGAGGYLVALGAGLLALALPAAAEEALFRGYPLQVLAQGIGTAGAVLVTSAVFAMAHGANPNVAPMALVNIFLAGVLLAVAYLRTRSLWFATAVHLGWNWAVAVGFDLPVSGLELFDPPVYDALVRGPEWVTGGAFGPEGGLAGTLGFAIALAAVAWWPGLGEAPEMREMRPLVDELGRSAAEG